MLITAQNYTGSISVGGALAAAISQEEAGGQSACVWQVSAFASAGMANQVRWQKWYR